MNPVNDLPVDFFIISLVLHSHLFQGLPSGFVLSGYPTKIHHTTLFYLPYPAHLILLGFIT